MILSLILVSLSSAAFAQDDDFLSLLGQARTALVAGEYKDARDLLTAAENAAPLSTTLLLQKDLARLYFYRGVLYWRASPEEAALENWRETLTIAGDFQPDPELLPDQSERDAFLALRDEVKAKGDVEVKLPDDPGEAVIYIDGRPLEPTDSVVKGRHFVQIKCEGGDLAASWYDYGDPPLNYLAICDGGVLRAGGHASSSAPKSSSSKSSSKPEKAEKPEKPEKAEKAEKEPKEKGGGGEVAKNVAGISLLGLGAGGGVASFLLYEAAAHSAEAYSEKREAARTNPDLRGTADDYYDNVLVPSYTRFYAGAAGTGVLLAGGILLVALDADGPMVAPLPGGGGVVTWSGHF